MYSILQSVQSDLAAFGGWCFLAGVFLMVAGDGLTTGDGRAFTYPGLNVTPKPVRGAATPIWIGGGMERPRSGLSGLGIRPSSRSCAIFSRRVSCAG